MQRAYIFALFAVFAVLPRTLKSQASPDPGSTQGNVYTNQFFRLTWEFPKEWTIKDAPVPAPGAHYYVLLNLLPAGSQSSEEVSLSAQDFAHSDHSWRQYLDQVKIMMNQKGWQIVETRHTVTVGDLIGFDTDEYKSADEKHYVAIMARPLRSHELKFFVSAPSHERLEDLIKTISLAKFAPDWTNGAIDNRFDRFQSSPGPISGGKLVNRVDPTYPTLARAAGIQGSVVLAAEIGHEGKIDQLYVLQGHPLLVDSAVEAVSGWSYTPYKRTDGTPVTVGVEIIVNFTLPGRK